MKCPVDADIELVMSERQGVEIDYCPRCRGIWLDRGELDKILDRAMPVAAAAVPMMPVPVAAVPVVAVPVRREEPRYDPRYRDDRDRDRHDSHDGHDSHDSHDGHDGRDSHDGRAYGDKKKRKGSWLGDILDF